MSRIRPLILALLLILPLAACGRIESWYAVREYVGHLEKKNYPAAYAMLSTDAQRITPLALFESAHRVPEAVRDLAGAAAVEYKIVSTRLTDDTHGIAEIEVIRPDLQAAIGGKMDHLVGSLFGGKSTGDDAVEAAPIPTVSEIMRLKLVKEAKGWRIEPQSY